jgi:hypothetical protein
MNSAVNQSKKTAPTTLSYGYVKRGQTIKWIFWEYDSFKGSKKICLEINTLSNSMSVVGEVNAQPEPLQNTPGFCEALGIDWLTKVMPNPNLFMDTKILEQVVLKKITNPSDLACFILGEDLSKKVPPQLFFRSVLTNNFFDSWDKIKVAILLLMVTENVHRTFDRIVDLTRRYYRSYIFYRLVNLCLRMGVMANCFIDDKKAEHCISILDKDNAPHLKYLCYITIGGVFSSCIDLVANYPAFASSAISFAEFEKKQVKSIYYGTLPLPKGMRLIDSPEELIKEGRRMSHCVASYIPQLKSKKSFFLHVKKEVSATVEIVKNTKKRCFEIKQIKGVSNAAVPASVVSSVKQAISTFDAQYFFYKNYYKSPKRRSKTQEGPTLFDQFIR